MSKMPIENIIKDPSASEVPDNASAARELFAEGHHSVDLKVQACDEDAITLFQKLPASLLPMLPYGYQWSVPRAGKVPSVIASDDAEDHELELVLYGPDRKKINYLFRVDHVIWQSFAHRKSGSGPKREYPMSDKQYTVPGFNYYDAKSQSSRHKLSAALRASSEKEVQITDQSLTRAANHGEKLLALDDEREIMTEDQIEKLRKKFQSSALGFFDPDDSKIDRFEKIYKDQRSPVKGLSNS